MRITRLSILLVILGLALCAIPFREKLRRPVVTTIQMVRGQATVSDRVREFGAVVEARILPEFERIGVAYPPRRMILIGLKAERMLQVWVAGSGGEWRHLKDYPIFGMSGVLGPKLKEGDRQVPEGLYRVESLNPNSLFHLALRVNYPNAVDRRNGKRDGRSDLGSDIMIHGKNCSIGCLAMGDEAAEDLFVLAARTGIDNVSIILSPVDFRVRGLPERMPAVPAWMEPVYEEIRTELAKLGPQQR